MISEEEQDQFKELIKKERTKLPSSKILVENILEGNPDILKPLEKNEISQIIESLCQKTYELYLNKESEFNKKMMKLLPEVIRTPKDVLEKLIDENTLSLEKEKLKERIREICGEYSGKIFPFLYILNLSTTQSRRSRSGQTFESVIYSLYEKLEWSYDSQKKVGAKLFKQKKLGKKVDSILPSIKCFEEKRDKVIIGTMKTSLRERWQEVAEEISRTNIPSIFLLTRDQDISSNKAKEMSEHNITVVVYEKIKKTMKDHKNLISFEEYFFEEIPAKFEWWKTRM
tara:strand:- start:120 stop:974 length:855 start_codon:yes stop_codon:yes gene_type:complete